MNYIYLSGIGLMMAKALENNGATVYIVGRRKEILEKAAAENNVRHHLPLVSLSLISIISADCGLLTMLCRTSIKLSH